ncbi:MAG: hypothetical protein ABIK28_16855 [Planctomycetota bacterium]
MARRQPEKAIHWEGIFADQINSGKSIAAFCKGRDIHPTQFYWWRRRLSNDAIQSNSKEGFVELLTTSGTLSGSSSGLTLIYDNRFHLQLKPGFDPATLKQVLAVLSERV